MSLGPYWIGDTPTDTIIVDLVRNGSPLPITGYASASITLTSPSGSAVDVSTADVDLVGSNSVTFRFPDVENLFTEPGIYTLQVLLHAADGGTDRGALIPVEVRSTNTGTDYGHWVTPAEVLQIVGPHAVVDIDDIFRAEVVIDAFNGAGQTQTHTARNLHNLKRATAYQAAFMQEQPDFASRHDVVSMNQDGLSFTTRDEASLVLHPVAKRFLERCSWAGSRTRPVTPSRAIRVTDPAISDYGQKWTRL